jgi:hypothetical protein
MFVARSGWWKNTSVIVKRERRRSAEGEAAVMVLPALWGNDRAGS